MIPRIIHQMWRDEEVPARFRAWQTGWQSRHPDWDYRFWTDATLEDFVAERFPALLRIYHRYPEGIMRADFARYLLLEHFGGVYADLDAECLASFEPLTGEARLLLAPEPPSHAALPRVRQRGLPWIACNAVMASPAGHDFWPFLRRLLLQNHRSRSVLDATGPFILTQALLDYPRQEAIHLLPPECVSPRDREGRPVGAPPPLAQHHWAGTWIRRGSRERRFKRYRRRLRAVWKLLRQEHSMSFRQATRGLDRALLARRAPPDGSVAILVPVRDAASTLPAFFAAVEGLEQPANRLSIAFLEGGSADDSAAMLRRWCDGPGRRYAAARLFRETAPYRISGERWAPENQRVRRGGLARARNALIREGLGTADWALWIDADVVAFPSDVLTRLLAAGERLATPHCVRQPGGPSFDLNSFVTDWEPPLEEWYRHYRDGLYQPPRGMGRLYLEDLRYLPKVRVDGLGATLLLVDGNLHRAGLVFPERPYRHLIETEAFAALAADLGIASYALPQLEILHAENG